MSRGLAYHNTREQDLADSGGRPVPVDPFALAEVLSDDLQLAWSEDNVDDSAYKNLIEQCLSIDPDDRPLDMQEVHRKIQAIKGEEAVSEPEPAKIEPEKVIEISFLEEESVEIEEEAEELVLLEKPEEPEIEEQPEEFEEPIPIALPKRKKRFIDWFRTEKMDETSEAQR